MKEAIVGNIIGWFVIIALLWLAVDTLIRIHRELGLLSNRGFLWGIAVISCNLIAIILYRRYRDKVEDVVETLFERRW